jgi:hypothetical protein
MRQLHECIANPSFDGDETKNLIGLGFWNSFLYFVKSVKECPDLNESDVRALMCAMDALVDKELGPHDESPEMTGQEVTPAAVAAAVPVPTNTTSAYEMSADADAYTFEDKQKTKFSLKRMRQLSGIVTTEDLL